MHVIERHIQQVRQEVEEAWNARAPQPGGERSGRAQELVFLCVNLWQATKEDIAECPPLTREARREVAATLRSIEQALGSVVSLAEAHAKAGARLKGLDRAAAALREVRGMILMPTARQMADRDAQGRSADELRELLLDRVEFVEGRPLITAELAKEFPYPLAPEGDLLTRFGSAAQV
jgi:hypothetical protein